IVAGEIASTHCYWPAEPTAIFAIKQRVSLRVLKQLEITCERDYPHGAGSVTYYTSIRTSVYGHSSPMTLRSRYPSISARSLQLVRWKFRMRPDHARHSPPRRGGCATKKCSGATNQSGADGVVTRAWPRFRRADHPVRSN